MSKIIGNTTATPNPQPDWNQTNPAKADYIKNKPDISKMEGIATTDYVDQQVDSKVDKYTGVLGSRLTLQTSPSGDPQWMPTASYQTTGVVKASGVIMTGASGQVPARATPTDNYEATSKKYVDTKHQEALEVANGKTQSFTVANIIKLGILFGIDITEVSDSYDITVTEITYGEKTYTLKQGDVFLIVDTDVPDYWVSINNMKLYKMETSKVDLTEYVKSDEFEDKMNEHPIDLTRMTEIFMTSSYGNSALILSGGDWSDMPISYQVDPYYLVQRDPNGDVLVSDSPLSDEAAVNKNYVDTAMKSTLTELVESTISLQMTSNTEYHCTSSVESLTITGFDSETEGFADQWSIIFTAGSTISVTHPDTVKWALATPVFDPNKTYWLSFIPFGNYYLGTWTVA